jgi:hypothetical protein
MIVHLCITAEGFLQQELVELKWSSNQPLTGRGRLKLSVTFRINRYYRNCLFYCFTEVPGKNATKSTAVSSAFKSCQVSTDSIVCCGGLLRTGGNLRVWSHPDFDMCLIPVK